VIDSALNLTNDEMRVLSEADACGFMVRSGWRVRLLATWHDLCRRNRRPCIVVIRGAREDRIEVDGQVLETLAAGEGERRAFEIAQNRTTTPNTIKSGEVRP
jgi:hypothetical protein